MKVLSKSNNYLQFRWSLCQFVPQTLSNISSIINYLIHITCLKMLFHCLFLCFLKILFFLFLLPPSFSCSYSLFSFFPLFLLFLFLVLLPVPPVFLLHPPSSYLSPTPSFLFLLLLLVPLPTPAHSFPPFPSPSFPFLPFGHPPPPDRWLTLWPDPPPPRKKLRGERFRTPLKKYFEAKRKK